MYALNNDFSDHTGKSRVQESREMSGDRSIRWSDDRNALLTVVLFNFIDGVEAKYDKRVADINLAVDNAIQECAFGTYARKNKKLKKRQSDNLQPWHNTNEVYDALVKTSQKREIR